ncbi:MAG: ribokinase [Rhodanobacteraceae bacterium]|nr:ribokinase [Rhodanobacteraceae bacterium]
MAGRVAVVGSYNQDHVWNSRELPQPGATHFGDYSSGPGGKGFNQAVAAARAGASVGFFCALGEDAAAEHARRLAADERIDMHVEVHAETPSGSAGIFVGDDGRNMIVVAAGANAELSADFVSNEMASAEVADVVLAQLEVNPEAVVAGLLAARSEGAISILNPAPADAATNERLLSLADVLTPNETEFAAMLARHDVVTVDADEVATIGDSQLHRWCRQLAGSASVIVTLGKHGAFVSHPADLRRGDGDDCYRVAAENVNAIDSTGAGDAFNGALAAALSAARPDAPFADSVRFAGRYAAMSTETAGAALAMPTLNAVLSRFD